LHKKWLLSLNIVLSYPNLLNMRKTLLPFMGFMLSFCISYAQNTYETYFQEGLAKQNKGDLAGAMLAYTSAIQANVDTINAVC
jgi:hypothetical protein